MIDSLRQALFDAVLESTSDTLQVAIAFSGGVDSSLLAKICNSGQLRKQVTLLTVGFSGSHDIHFSKDIALKMGIDHKIYEITYSDFEENLQLVRKLIQCNNTSHIENCIAYFYICKLAKQNDLNIVLGANGCDELFCGYDKYRNVCHNGRDAEISMLMDKMITNELALVEEIKIVASQLSVQVRQPFLSARFVEFAKSIPIDQKIKGPEDRIRKHILRQVALSMGVSEESAMKPKKALQYGSSIHRYFKEIERKRERVL